MLVIGLFTMLTAEFSPAGCSALVIAGSVPRTNLLLPVDSALPAWSNKSINKIFDNKAENCDLVVDCGATKHCLSHEDCLLRVTERRPAHGGVRIGDGKLLPVSAIGDAAIPVATLTSDMSCYKACYLIQACNTIWHRVVDRYLTCFMYKSCSHRVAPDY